MMSVPIPYWTTGKFAEGYVPTAEEGKAALTRTLQIYNRGLRDLEESQKEVQGWGSARLPGKFGEVSKHCGKVHSCGHPCYDNVWEERVICSDCRVPKLVTRGDCGHKTTVFCASGPPLSKCTVACSRLLPCGHPCSNQCGQPCLVECRHRDCWKLRRDHEAEVRKKTSPSASSFVTEFDDEEW